MGIRGGFATHLGGCPSLAGLWGDAQRAERVGGWGERGLVLLGGFLELGGGSLVGGGWLRRVALCSSAVVEAGFGLLRAPLASSHHLAFPAVPALGKPRGEQQTGGRHLEWVPQHPMSYHRCCCQGFCFGSSLAGSPSPSFLPSKFGASPGCLRGFVPGEKQGLEPVPGDSGPGSCLARRGGGSPLVWGRMGPNFSVLRGRSWAGVGRQGAGGLTGPYTGPFVRGGIRSSHVGLWESEEPRGAAAAAGLPCLNLGCFGGFAPQNTPVPAPLRTGECNPVPSLQGHRSSQRSIL